MSTPDTDPLAPWLRDIEAEHAARRHSPDTQCRGSVTLIDEAARLRGAAAIRLGKTESLGHEIDTRPASVGDGPTPLDFQMQVGTHGRSVHAGDVVTYNAHGTGNTHLDGLAHIGVDGSWHGPIPIEASETDEDTIVTWAKHGIATRGVLLDLTAVRGVDWIASGEPPTTAEFDAALAATGVTLEPGDALLVYQGRDRFEAAGHSYPTGAAAAPRPGIGEDGAKWIAQNEPGVLVWDFHDARHNERGALEVHNLIYATGLCIIDNAHLGAAAAALAAAGTSTGMLVASPVAIHRSSGVLINPVLIY